MDFVPQMWIARILPIRMLSLNVWGPSLVTLDNVDAHVDPLGVLKAFRRCNASLILAWISNLGALLPNRVLPTFAESAAQSFSTRLDLIWETVCPWIQSILPSTLPMRHA
jgi:hypothetical protein